MATERDNRLTRREILASGLGMAAALGLSGCWSDGARRAYPDRIPVRFWHMWTAEWQAVVERIADRFNRSQARYEVVPLSVPASGADAKYLLAITGGDPPDVMAQWNPVLPTWAENGALTSLDELMTPAERAWTERETYPVFRRAGIFRGRRYAMPLGPNISACFYRPDHFRKAGLDPDRFPEDLETLVQWADRLHQFDRSGQLKRIGFLPQYFTQFAPLFGGGFYDERTGALTLNTPPNRRALTFLADYRRKLGFGNVIRFTSGLAGDTSGGVDWPFLSGAYSITQDGQWRIEQLEKFAPHLEYRTAPLPPPAGGRRLAGWATSDMLLVPRGSRQPQGAWEFIKFWSGLERPERAAEFYLWGGWLPIADAIAYAPVYQSYIQKHPALRTFLELAASPNLVAPPPVPFQAYLVDHISRAEDLAVRGTRPPEQALVGLEADIAKERARRKELGYAD
ncbi:MAG TPA: ABC transporter substrate-binding protein [Chthonomonadaceae bacterium]|nr:ABC transporter substrate-binding protein [Chthonomonadaceae bacterium]